MRSNAISTECYPQILAALRSYPPPNHPPRLFARSRSRSRSRSIASHFGVWYKNASLGSSPSALRMHLMNTLHAGGTVNNGLPSNSPCTTSSSLSLHLCSFALLLVSYKCTPRRNPGTGASAVVVEVVEVEDDARDRASRASAAAPVSAGDDDDDDGGDGGDMNARVASDDSAATPSRRRWRDGE